MTHHKKGQPAVVSLGLDGLQSASEEASRVHLRIVAEDGTVVGDFEAQSGSRMWMDILLYASKKWEDVALPATVSALGTLLMAAASQAGQ